MSARAIKLRICHLIGHRRGYDMVSKMRYSRRGYMYLGSVAYARCLRCGLGEPDCYAISLLERLAHQWDDLLGAMRRCEQVPMEGDDSIPF